jgi:hypothetical protein
MPKVAPQLSRFKNKELRSRKEPEPNRKKSTFVQSGKPVNFGPGWEKQQHDERERKWKKNKTRTPRSPYITQRGAKNLDSRKEASLARAEEQRLSEEESVAVVEIPTVPVIEAQKSTLSKLAEMAESSLGLVAFGITGRFLRKKQ